MFFFFFSSLLFFILFYATFLSLFVLCFLFQIQNNFAYSWWSLSIIETKYLILQFKLISLYLWFNSLFFFAVYYELCYKYNILYIFRYLYTNLLLLGFLLALNSVKSPTPSTISIDTDQIFPWILLWYIFFRTIWSIFWSLCFSLFNSSV